MKVFAIWFTLLTLSAAREHVSLSEIDTLISKFVLKQLTKEEYVTFQEVLGALQRPEPISTMPLEESSAFRLTLDCIICRSAVSAIIDAVRDGQTEEELIDTMTVLCTNLGLFTYNVCHGALVLNAHIITYIIKSTPEVSANTFCGLVLQSAANPNACPYLDPRFEWEVELPEIAEGGPKIAPYNDGKLLKVAVITDAHIDPLYEPFGVADCDEPVCCRIGQNPAQAVYKTKFEESSLRESFTENNGEALLNLSFVRNFQRKNHRKIHLQYRKPEPAGYWGDYRNCDSPKWAYDDVIDQIKENHDDIDLLYYVGDTIDHGVWETSYELIDDINFYMVDKIKRTFGNKVTVIPAIGNHESQPTNQFAPSSVTVPGLNTTWLYKALASKWSQYLPDDAKESLVKHGSFSVLVKPGLRVISLNNNVPYKFNWWLIYDPLDSKRKMEWLIAELYKAELQGEKVHILAHIPPGSPDLTHTWTREYNRVINRFSSTITAEFNGHTHTDEFRIFYSPDNKPINIAWGAGGVTAYSFYNLNYKIIKFKDQTSIPDSIDNYVYNLTEANLTPQRRPHWFLLYDMKNSFELNDLSPSSLDSLVHSMVTDKRNLLTFYSAITSKLSDAQWQQCDDECKLNKLCVTVVTILWERERCEELRRKFYS